MPRDIIPHNRLACDRCHSQKLRCQRQEGQGSCLRCSRANAACVFSPRQRRTGVPKPLPPPHQQQRSDPPPDLDQNVAHSTPPSSSSSVSAPPAAEPDAHAHADEPSGLGTRMDGISPNADADVHAASSLGFDLGMLGNTASDNNSGLGTDQFMAPIQLGAGGPSATDPITLSDWPGLLGFDTPAADFAGLNPEQEWNYHLGRGLLLGQFADTTTATTNSLPNMPSMPSMPSNMPSNMTLPNDMSLTSNANHDLSHNNRDANNSNHNGGSMSSPGSGAEDNRSFDAVGYVRSLADLNVRLYEHSGKLPPVTLVPTGRVPSLDGQVFAIDETFRMTQTLIDVLKALYPRAGPVPDFAPDQGTLLLIMSCSNRVFDIYEVILGHMRGCIQHNITPVTAEGKTIVLPQLRIGSFAPPTPSAIAMHMLLIILMASELFDQLQEVLGCWRHNRHGAGGPLQSSPSRMGAAASPAFSPRTRFPEFTEEVATEMDRRARGVAVEIVNTRHLLLSISGLRGGSRGPRPINS